jgi:F-type H+-transporting ATPase subunit b
MELLKLLNANEIAAQIVSFLLLLLLLRIFVWSRILKLLDERKERIAGQFRELAESRAEAAKLSSEYDKKLKDIDSVAQARINEAMVEARQLAEDIKKEARDEGHKIIESARENIKHELQKAKEELKGQIIDLTISATENIIEEKLTETKDRKLVEDFLDNLDKA